MRYKATGKSLELIDKVNPTKTKYKQKIITELVSFTWIKATGYIWLNVVIKGELNGKELPVYQIDGKPVELEKVSDFIYRYKVPSDEVKEVRVFEVSLVDGEGETKTLRAVVETEPFIYYLTSTIYPINLIEDLGTNFKGLTGRMLTSSDLGLKASQYESFTQLPDRLSGTLAKVLVVHDYYKGASSSIDGLSSSIGNLSATMRELLRQKDLPFEKGAISSINAISGTLRTILIAYTFYKPESLITNTDRITGTIEQLPEYFESFINAETTEYDPSDSDGGSTTVIICEGTGDEIIANPIVNANTKSALDFENGIVDQVSTTIWNKGGTATVTSINKISGSSSFETKALGDSLYTNSNIITGGSTPFTIEFYALIKDIQANGNATIYSQNNSIGAGSQYLGLKLDSGYKPFFDRQVNNGVSPFNVTGNTNIKLNDINKFTTTYDGSALRLFINDKLDIVVGTLSGWNINALPFEFLNWNIPSYESYRTYTKGIVDNINIFDGEARVVRDYDEHADKLVVDLAFDGENNSTKIVDNENIENRNKIKYNDNIVSLLHFEEYNNSIFTDECGHLYVSNGSATQSSVYKKFGSSSLSISTTDNSNISCNSNDFIFGTGDYTIECFFMVSGGNNNIFIFDGGAVYVNEAANLLTLYSSGNRISIGGIVLNEWMHVALIRKDGNVSLYLNGIKSPSWQDTRNLNTGLIQIGGSTVGTGGKYYIDELRVIKGKAVYAENFTPPTIPFNYVKHNKWTVSGGAKISTDQKFDGFSSLYIPSSTNKRNIISSETYFFPKTEDFTISFKFKRLPSTDQFAVVLTTGIARYITDTDAAWSINAFTSSYPNQSYSNLRNKFSLINEKNYTGYDSAIVSNTTIIDNIEYNVSFVKKDTFIYIYINGVLDVFSDVYKNNDIDFKNLCIGSELWTGAHNGFTGYLKDLKIYKGVAVIPESPAGKIQLDFDNNVIDKYNNSTWTNNGVIFDQVNSVKGYAAKFDGANKYLQSNYSFFANNISYNFDLKTNSAIPNKILRSASNAYQMNIYANGTLSLDGRFDLPVNTVLHNTYYKHEYVGKTNLSLYKLNDVVIAQSNVFTALNWNDFLIGDNGSFGNFNMDNFKATKDSQDVVIIDKPAVHLPLETNAINTGFTSLTINSVGNPTYTTVDGKKCIKFESGKYLIINSNNIFNLGTSSDFYIEVMLYPNNSSRSQWFLSDGEWVYGSTYIGITTDNKIYFTVYNTTSLVLTSSNEIIRNSWNTVKLFRKNNIVFIEVNSILTEYKNINAIINFTYKNTYIGQYSTNGSDNLNGYMSNFKMFVGTSEIPETYNDKKVLDLDFKPTRKSYLFKDNNNKCVIHPINITQRDYQDSKYCCTFNGTNQYLQLGKNDLLNFGNDDFVINIKFKWDGSTVLYGTLISNGFINSVLMDFLMVHSNNTLSMRSNNVVIFDNIPVPMGNNDLVVYRSGNTLTVILNDVNYNYPINTLFNLNNEGNTNIGRNGWDGANGYFKGTIYSIKVLRNTSDLTLLESSGSGGQVCREVIVPNPPLDVRYPLKLNSLDSFTTEWSQLNANSPVTYKELGSGNTGLFFDGTGGLVSTNKNYKLGSSKFTIDLDLLLSSYPTASFPSCILSYGKSINIEGWYNLEVTSTGVIRFGTAYDGNYISSNSGVIKVGVKQSIGVTRDVSKVLRIFVDNVKVAEGLFNTALEGGNLTNVNQNFILIGRDKIYHNNFNSTYGLKGFIDNLYINRGVCKYTETPTRVPVDYKLNTKSLLNIGSESIGTIPTTIIDSFDNAVVWNNNGVNVVTESSLRPAKFNFTTLSNRLVAQSTNFELSMEDFTLDVIFTTNQTISEAVLLDLRKVTEPYKGILISQSAGSPASLTIDIGSNSANTGVDYSFNTGVNSLTNGVRYHLRVVRNLGTIYIFMNGVLKDTLTIDTSSIPTDSKVTLGNSNSNSKGFNGTITQFRFIKGIATNIIDFSSLTEELK